ncbi:uncharacterized protein LOC125673054 [Ostrea edulis]|uniref:uncharacterized protein LOC125673054 n=1 Tax=Ostrea edulis TaxID=37623 RepID=UPI0024AE968C|nr:uncharacterized protein LOC125673054 [Ostrea edulis]XP_048765278.2 uncharacterized protein LOC125673054 [Ostrea edulis]
MNNETLPSMKYSGCTCRKTANFDYKRKRKGKKFNVYKGRMYSCSNDIQTAAVKINTRGEGTQEDLADYVDSSQAAQDLVNKFSKLCNVSVRFPECHVAEMDTVAVFNRFFSGNCRKPSSDEVILFEPYIEDLQCFISRAGVVTEACPAVIRELCHFSFHESNGTNILRGLKGAWEKNGKGFRLASPATKYFPEKCSTSEIQCAITNFFSCHKCSSRCEKWLVPSQVQSSPRVCQTSAKTGLNFPQWDSLPPPYESREYRNCFEKWQVPNPVESSLFTNQPGDKNNLGVSLWDIPPPAYDDTVFVS